MADLKVDWKVEMTVEVMVDGSDHDLAAQMADEMVAPSVAKTVCS